MKNSPWGRVQGSNQIAPGIVSVYTASHGGIHLDRKLNQQVPESARRAGGWYEEDCEWSIVALVFPQHFSAEALEHAKRSCKEYHPHEYTAITGEQVEPSESWALRQKSLYR